MNREEIMKLIPHRPPILLLDRIEELEPGRRGVGCRVFQPDDPCFAGHFPERPILPGVLIIEAVAQTALAVLLSGVKATDDGSSAIGLLAKIEKARFLRPIVAGDSVGFEAVVKKKVGAFFMVSGRVTRLPDQAVCATCDVTLTMAAQ